MIPPTESPSQEKATSIPGKGAAPESAGDFVWTFRGYRLRASEFTTAMAHLFRAEVHRSNVWRQRLDITTNWAVVTTGAALSIAFAQPGNHVVILLNLLLATIFLLIEARRYRYYELWAYRVRLMETDFYAPMLVPPFHPSADWAEALSESLLHPHFPISYLEAIGRRLRRNYLYIYTIIGTAWLARLWLLPHTARSWTEFFQRASIGPVNGELIFFIVSIFTVGMISIGLGTSFLHETAGEVVPRYGTVASESLSAMAEAGKRAWFRPSRRRPQLLTLIVTDQAQTVADQILKNLNRGATALSGTGMYTNKAHTILMCALTVTEVPQLKALVSQADPNAFVIVIPAQEILGQGFVPLQE
jgi:uncharacterized membrane protein